MTAPIVWELDRQEMSPEWVESIAHTLGSTKQVAADRGAFAERFGRPAGQLWERLAERAEAHT